MDNTDFSKLVQARVKGNSSREVARNAVESEFKRRRRRKNDDSSDDEERPKKFQKKRKLETEDAEEDTPDISNYRDRAKERREGKAEEEAEQSDGDWLEDVNPEDLSSTVAKLQKKGLDRSQLKHSRAAPLIHEEHEEESSKIPLEQPFETTEQAKEWLQQYAEEGTPSSFAQSILKYLCPPKIVPQNVERTNQNIVQSILTFSTVAEPGDWPRAWLVPEENVYGGGNTDAPRATPLSSELCGKIGKAMLLSRISRAKPAAKEPPRKEESKEDGDSSSEEEDIFGNAGHDYDPLENDDSSKEEGEA